ncbi:uncharacterized protein LOC124532470 [Vanessa cardui]|uniref:uncharacterized protein LOC124532470 n=1 Tax=Vanessa cardui TaxID=171605 RepID=UPI001F12BEA3|nr:uncharacterized protein LOC124532470 [Vanessa cardui]
MFYNNLEEVMKRCPSFGDGTRLFCLDETGTTTVQKPKRVLALKGSKQLNKVTSGERGTLVTTCCAVSATGNALPPAMVFPRKNFKTPMLKGAPIGTLGLAQPTGWMNTELFPQVIKHFVKVTGSSKTNPSLFILDNHDSHLALEALNIAKENGMTLLTISPHSSHKLQPLDVSVFGPLQNYYNAAIDSWLLRHPGVPVTIYNIAELLGEAFEKAMTPINIKSGFRKTGIFPFDRNIFTSEDFMPSEITNRTLESSASLLLQHEQTANQTTASEISLMQENEQSLNRPSTSKNSEEQNEQLSNQNTAPETLLSLQQNFEEPQKVSDPMKQQENISLITNDVNRMEDILASPIECREYPKAGPRISKKGRKRGKSCIATDTPIKQEFEEASKERENKKRKKKTPNEGNIKIKRKPKRVEKVTKVLFASSEKGSENLDEDSDIVSSGSDDIPLCLLKTPEKDDFVVVKFMGKQTKHYIGKLLTNNELDEYDVSYLRKSSKVDNVFYFPLEPDLAIVKKDDIELILPLPKTKKQTKRQADFYSFPEKILRQFNLC